jgi:hypothetical protein
VAVAAAVVAAAGGKGSPWLTYLCSWRPLGRPPSQARAARDRPSSRTPSSRRTRRQGAVGPRAASPVTRERLATTAAREESSFIHRPFLSIRLSAPPHSPLPRLSRASPAPLPRHVLASSSPCLGVSRLSRSDRPNRRLHRPSPPPPHTTPPHTTTTTTADDDDDDDDDDDEDDGKRARGPPIATLYFPRPLHIPLLCHIARLAVLASLPADFYPRCRILAPIDLG